MRRAGRYVLFALLVIAGCAGALDLDDGTVIVRADGGYSSSTSGGYSSTTSGGTSGSTSSEDADDIACSPAGAVVYQLAELTDADARYRYQTSPAPVDGFEAPTPMFRLAADGSPRALRPLYLLQDDAGDFMVSSDPTEDSYFTLDGGAALGDSYVVAYPGTLPVFRRVHRTPLRHRLDLGGDAGADAGDDWEDDGTTYHVCPL